MCIPEPKEAAIPAPNIPSMESASGLDLAGVPRGAAGLARLKLRTGAASAQTSAAKIPANAALTASAPGTGSSPFSTLTLPSGGLTLPIP